MAGGSALAFFLLCLCAHPSTCENKSDSVQQIISEWTDLATDLVGIDMVEGVSRLLDRVYSKLDKSPKNSPEKENPLDAVMELIERMGTSNKGSANKLELQTGIQMWLLENLLKGVLRMEESAPDLELLKTIRRHIEDQLKERSPDGTRKVLSGVAGSMTTVLSGAAPVVNLVMEDPDMGGRQEREVQNRPDPFYKISKLSAPFNFLKDLVLAAKTDVHRFIKNIWSTKVILSKTLLGKVLLIWEKLKGALFGGVDLYVDVKKYLFREILGPLDFISSKLSKNTSEKCLMHNFCVYGMKFLKLQEKYPILAKVTNFFPKQKFPVIFLDDLLKSKDKLTYNPNLATALMYGKEKGECKSYPPSFC